MNNWLSNFSVISILLLSIGSNADAAPVDIPMTLDNWAAASSGDNQGNPGPLPTFEQTADGIKFYGTGYRVGGGLMSNLTADLSDATIYFKWMINPGNQPYTYGTVGAGALNSTNILEMIGGNYTTGWSWNNSSVLPATTWLYSRIVTHPDMTWSITTSTLNYDSLGGSVVSTQSYSWQVYPSAWENDIRHGHLAARLGDNYGGTSAWVLIGEAKYEAAATPEPASPWLMLSGLAAWLPCYLRSRKS